MSEIKALKKQMERVRVCELTQYYWFYFNISIELFQILKDDVVKVLHIIYQQIWKTQHSGQRTGKGQFSFQSQRKATPKTAQTTTELYSSHTLVK